MGPEMPDGDQINLYLFNQGFCQTFRFQMLQKMVSMSGSSGLYLGLSPVKRLLVIVKEDIFSTLISFHSSDLPVSLYPRI